jgi:H+/Na+-translocating ferredoxin:NAD+ oxidoreductase subunit B
MNTDEIVYRTLQKHLDSQAVGFPETKSGVEIRILKHIFSPDEAKIATFLNYKPETIETIYQRIKDQIDSKEMLSEILDASEKKGGIETKMKGETKFYCNAPLVVGMYEYQTNRLTPEFVADFEQYTSGQKFGVEFLSTELPQMRTIPIGKSITFKSDVSTFDEAISLLKQSNGVFTILPCICREKKKVKGKSCKITDRKETCLAIGDLADSAIRNNISRRIDLDEAISILGKNQKEGLVFQPSNTQQADFICSCCGCCCGMLSMQKNLPKPIDFWSSNYFAVIDNALCEGCGNCEKKCQVGAVKVSEDNQKFTINLDRCIGCGLCVTVCPSKALTLQKKSKEITPPMDREELYETIMSKKKGKLGKLKITGKLIFDAVTTGQTQLLK